MIETKNAPMANADVLLRELRFGNVDKSRLEELVEIVAGIQKRGMRRSKVFTKGTPLPDGIRLTGIVDAQELNTMLGEILTKTPYLSGVAVFPYGIPWPDIFKVSIDLGGTSAGQEASQGY